MTPSLDRLLLAVTVTLLAAYGNGCYSEDAVVERSRAVATVVDSSALVPVVRNYGVAPAWTVEPLGSVGGLADLGNVALDEFARISSVTTGPDDLLWVADQLGNDIRVFRPSGSLVLRLGRRGAGPGEYRSIHSIAWVADRLLVLDPGNGRVAEVSSTGDWLGTRPAPGGVSGSPATLRFYPVTDSSVVQWSLGTQDGAVAPIWVEHGADGILGTWPQLAREPLASTTIVCDRPDGAVSFFSTPFAGEILQHPARSGLTYRAWSTEYRFALLDPTGDTLRVVEREWPTLAVTDEEWDRETAEFAAFREEWPEATCQPRNMRRPETRAPLRNLLMDPEGRVWVEAVGATGAVWEVFDLDGRLLGQIPGFGYEKRVAPSIRGMRIAWVSMDSLGIQRVHWARVIDAP